MATTTIITAREVNEKKGVKTCRHASQALVSCFYILLCTNMATTFIMTARGGKAGSRCMATCLEPCTLFTYYK